MLLLFLFIVAIVVVVVANVIPNEAYVDIHAKTEFDEFEKQRIGEIRDDIAEGKKPRGYDYEDVPQPNV